MKNKLRLERLPTAIYRLGPATLGAQKQCLNEQDPNAQDLYLWGFDFVKDMLPYLHSMGFSTLSIPSVLQSKTGHTGPGRAELVSFSRINRDFGGESSFLSLTKVLDDEYTSMSLVVDLEPQFMSFSTENEATAKLLLDGPCAVNSELFDINWRNGRSSPGTIALPILADPYLESIKKRHLKFEFFRSTARFSILYGDQKFPVCPRSLSYFFAFAPHAIAGTELEHPQVLRAFKELENMARSIPFAQLVSQKQERLEKVKSFFAALRKMVLDITWLGRGIEHAAEKLNTTGKQTTEVLHNIVYSQAYQFFHKQGGALHQNYRTCNDDPFTIAAAIERRAPFEAVHAAQVMLLKTKCVIGFRVSRFNAIGDPVRYLQSLKSMIDKRTSRFKYCIFAESDSGCEEFKDPFPIVTGFSGIDFVSLVTRFLSSGDGIKKFKRMFAADRQSLEFYYQPRRKTLNTRLVCDLNRLHTELILLCSREPSLQDFDDECIQSAFSEFVVVQRYERLFARLGRTTKDMQVAQMLDSVQAAFKDSVMMRSFTKNQKTFLKEFSRKLIEVLALDLAADSGDDPWTVFFSNLQIMLQKLWTLSVVEVFRARETVLLFFSENTSLFKDSGLGINDFHNCLAHRAKVLKQPLNASESFESDLSADIHCRLAALTENAEAWNSLVKQLCESVRSALPQSLQSVFESRFANMFFQALFGIYTQTADKQLLCKRIIEYFRMKIRLGRVYSDPVHPDLEFERQFAEAVNAILFQDSTSRFYQTFEAFFLKYAPFGALLSASFVILQCTVPGIPELGMGSEITTYRLGKQDAIDETSHKQLNDIIQTQRLETQRLGADAVLQQLLLNWNTGHLKIFVYDRLLHLRKEIPKLFLEGNYKPVKVTGANSGHLFAFLRIHDALRQTVLVVVSRGLLSMNVGFSMQLPRFDWEDHHLLVEEYEGTSWVDVLTGFAYNHVERKIHLGLLLRTAPFAVLKRA